MELKWRFGKFNQCSLMIDSIGAESEKREKSSMIPRGFCLSKKVPFTQMWKRWKRIGKGDYKELHQRHIKCKTSS